MDTLSSSVPTIKIPSLHPLSHHQLNHFKNHFPQQPTTTTPKKTSIVSNKTTTFKSAAAHSSFISPRFVNAPPPPAALPLKQSSAPSDSHRRAPTGYAVALLDVARCGSVLEAVARDVKRLSKWLHNEHLQGVISDPYMDKKEKGEILKEVVGKGKFHKHLVKLVNLIVAKTKVEMLSEVLDEFGRIYDELTGGNTIRTQMVLVPPGLKMEENQVLEIAKRVQKVSGALKVKVRQHDERLTSFAVL